MQIHELKSRFRRPKTKRVGRGGKRGTTSGKGQKGQRARSGHRIRPAERDLLQRLPKLRGVKNKSRHKDVFVIRTDEIPKIFGESPVNRRSLIAKGLIRKISDKVKILAHGEVKQAFTIEGLPVSKQARAKIEKAGGKVLVQKSELKSE